MRFAGLVGKQACAQDKDECKLNVCANGSECKEKSNGFTCTCKTGGPWEGARCNEDVNECEGDESVCDKASGDCICTHDPRVHVHVFSTCRHIAQTYSPHGI